MIQGKETKQQNLPATDLWESHDGTYCYLLLFIAIYCYLLANFIILFLVSSQKTTKSHQSKSSSKSQQSQQSQQQKQQQQQRGNTQGSHEASRNTCHQQTMLSL